MPEAGAEQDRSRSQGVGLVRFERRQAADPGSADADHDKRQRHDAADRCEYRAEDASEARRKIGDLRKLEHVLNDMAAQCHGDRVPQCPIADALLAKA